MEKILIIFHLFRLEVVLTHVENIALIHFQGIKVNRQNNFETIKKLKKISHNFPGSHIIFRDPVFSLNIKETKYLFRFNLQRKPRSTI